MVNISTHFSSEHEKRAISAIFLFLYHYFIWFLKGYNFKDPRNGCDGINKREEADSRDYEFICYRSFANYTYYEFYRIDLYCKQNREKLIRIKNMILKIKGREVSIWKPKQKIESTCFLRLNKKCMKTLTSSSREIREFPRVLYIVFMLWTERTKKTLYQVNTFHYQFSNVSILNTSLNYYWQIFVKSQQSDQSRPTTWKVSTTHTIKNINSPTLLNNFHNNNHASQNSSGPKYWLSTRKR
jgi:hypothetical protein